jgi:hypothetical protein
MPEKARLADLVLAEKEDENILVLLRDIVEAESDDQRSEAEKALNQYSGSLNLRQKVDSYSRLMAFFEAQQTSMKGEKLRLDRRMKYWQRQADRLEQHAAFALTLVNPDHKGRLRLEGNHSTLTLRDNPVKVELHGKILDLPEEFIRVTVTMPLLTWMRIGDRQLVDKIEYDAPLEPIRKAIEGGREIPGATLSQSVRVQRT